MKQLPEWVRHRSRVGRGRFVHTNWTNPWSVYFLLPTSEKELVMENQSRLCAKLDDKTVLEIRPNGNVSNWSRIPCTRKKSSYFYNSSVFGSDIKKRRTDHLSDLSMHIGEVNSLRRNSLLTRGRRSPLSGRLRVSRRIVHYWTVKVNFRELENQINAIKNNEISWK